MLIVNIMCCFFFIYFEIIFFVYKCFNFLVCIYCCLYKEDYLIFLFIFVEDYDGILRRFIIVKDKVFNMVIILLLIIFIVFFIVLVLEFLIVVVEYIVY